MPANASAMLLQALANARVPRIVPQAQEPSNQAEVYATRGVLGDGLQAWQTLQGRNEGALDRGAKQREWEARNANAVRLGELSNAGHLAVTREQGANQLAVGKQNAMQRMLADAEARAWAEQAKFPHEQRIQELRNRGVRDAALARPRPSPRVPTDPAEAMFMRAADKLYTSADKLVQIPSFGADRKVIAQREVMANGLRKKAGMARQLHVQYQMAKRSGDAEAARSALEGLASIMGGQVDATPAPQDMGDAGGMDPDEAALMAEMERRRAAGEPE